MNFECAEQLGNGFLRLPWHTDVFQSTDLAQRFCGCPEAEEYVRRIVERERDHRLHPAIGYAQQFLRGELTEKSNQLHLAAGLGCLLDYKLADVLLWRHVQGNATSCNGQLDSIHDVHTWPGDKVQDWRSVVSKAYSACSVLSSQDFHQRAKDLTDTDSLKKLMRNTRKGGAFLKILGNIVAAADLLQHLLRGNLDFSVDDYDKAPPTSTNADATYDSQRTPAQIRAALHAALVVGPVYLLKPAHVENSPISRTTLIDTWRILGTKQPQSLMKCNLLLWDLIVDGATGRRSLYAGLCETLDKCNEILKEVNEPDARWYSRDHERFKQANAESNSKKDGKEEVTSTTRIGEGEEDVVSYQTRKAYHLAQNRTTASGEDDEPHAMDIDPESAQPNAQPTTEETVDEQSPDDVHAQARMPSGNVNVEDIRRRDDEDACSTKATSTEDVVMESTEELIREAQYQGESISTGDKMDIDDNPDEAVRKSERIGKDSERCDEDEPDGAKIADERHESRPGSNGEKDKKVEFGKEDPTRTLRSLSRIRETQAAQVGNASAPQKQEATTNLGKRKRNQNRNQPTAKTDIPSTSPDSDAESSGSDVVYLGSNLVSCTVDLGPLYQSKPRIKTEDIASTISFDREVEATSTPLTIPHVYADRDIELFDLETEERTTHRPYCHYDEDLKLLYDVNEEARRMYHNGRPAYFTPGAASSIHLMSYDEFQKSTTEQLSGIFETKHIAIYGKPDLQYDFTREDIEKVFGISASVTRTIQDQTVKCEHKYTEWNRQGCLIDILNSARLGEQGKSLNGLDNRLSFDWAFHSVLETDRIAWQEAEDLAFCPSNERFPMNDMRWGLVGNAGCYSLIHIDSNGFATVVEVLSGLKEWFVAVPKPGKGVDAFATVHTFTRGYQTEGLNKDRFDWEKICLDSRTIFIQRPCTPHIVFTPKHSFVRGRFFYSTSTLQLSVYGIFHDLAIGENITNTEHNKASIALLTRILAFYHLHYVGGREVVQSAHLPNFLDFSSVIRVSALCAHFEVANALYNLNDDPEDEQIKTRHLFIRNRKRGRELVNLIDRQYIFKRKGNNDAYPFLQESYSRYVAKIAYLFYLYRVQSDIINKRDPLTAPDVLVALRKCFEQHPPVQDISIHFERNVCTGLKEAQQTFEWSGATYYVEKSPEDDYVYEPADGLNGDDLSFGLEPHEVYFEDFPDLLAQDGAKANSMNTRGTKSHKKKQPRKA